jgi:CHRD domain-containing protein
VKLRTIGIVTTIAMVATLTFVSAAAAHHGNGHGGGRSLSATLTGAAEVPGPGDPDGSGTVVLWVKPSHNRVCFDIRVSAITLPATAAHIHQAPVGVAGGIVVTLGTPDATGKASGCVSAAYDLLKAIKKNPSEYYVNVHTTDFPNGALRGQLARGSGQGQGSNTFQTSLKGTNEVPGPGDTDGSGSATITVDRTLNQVCFTIHVSGITPPATAAHIHQGAAGVAGPIVVTLTAPDATGSSSGCTVVTLDLVNAILANPSGYYVNVHTTDYPNGALRGQLSGEGNGCEGDDDEGGDGNGGGEHVAEVSFGGSASAHVSTTSRDEGGGCGDDDDDDGDHDHDGNGDGGGDHHHGGGG